MTRRLRKQCNKTAANKALIEMGATLTEMKKKAHVFMCHGFVSEVEYKKMIRRINEYYKPMMHVFQAKVKKEKRKKKDEKAKRNMS